MAPTDDAVEQSPRQAQDGVLVIDRGEVNRTDVLRMAFRYIKNAAAVDVVHEDWVDFNTFICILGGLEGVATDPIKGFIALSACSHLTVT